ncbi:MAG: C10 family peptidase [Prevotella sp.]|nr:C10 family peptidase [Prevotella sp.]
MKQLCVIILLALSLASVANPVDVSKARQVAMQFIETKSQSDSVLKSRASLVPRLELSYIQDGEVGNVFYVFNQSGNQGYVIVSADDRAAPVLGYADTGSFDVSDLPDGLRNLLKSYEEQITCAVKSNAGRRRASKERADIAPLIQTQWNQWEPYNNLCPIDPNTGERSLTGCVAVAKAQLLYYHRYPETGRGTISYEWKNRTLSADFSKANFEWDKMKLKYYYDTPDPNDAVAKLLWYCAVESRANFGSNSTPGYFEADELAWYFGYKDEAKWLERDDTTDEAFEDTLYQDLAKGLPVFFHGKDPVNGWSHAFLVDGYRQDGYFHMNFGWGGQYDGFYLLSAINLNSQGNYTSNQIIIYNIQPDIPGKWFLLTDDGRFFEMDAVGDIVADPDSETDLLLIDASGNVMASGFTSVSFFQTDGSTPGSLVKGDANCDTKVNVADLEEIANYILGKPSSLFNSYGADLNNDLVVNIADLVRFIKMLKSK